jgi:AcrR family transcriptional regulator
MQRRATITRQSILNSAAELFAARGYLGTSIRDISTVIGCTTGAVYFHFESKEALARAILDAHYATWPPMVEASLDWPGMGVERIVVLSFRVAAAFRDDALVRAGERLWNEHTMIPVDMPTPYVGWIATMDRLLRLADAEGELRPGLDLPKVARVLVAAFFGTHTISNALDGRRHIHEAVEHMWLVLLPALQLGSDPQATLKRTLEGLEAADAADADDAADAADALTAACP